MTDPNVRLELLDLIDEENNVLDQATWQEIHEKGWLHREVHVWLVSPDGEIIFQKRGLDKTSHPGLLDATVGGHVAAGESFKAGAIRETSEEVGMAVDVANMGLVFSEIRKTFEPKTGMTNNVLRMSYVVPFFDGSAALVSGEGEGFETWGLDELRTLSESQQQKFIPYLVGSDYMSNYGKMVDYAMSPTLWPSRST